MIMPLGDLFYLKTYENVCRKITSGFFGHFLFDILRA